MVIFYQLKGTSALLMLFDIKTNLYESTAHTHKQSWPPHMQLGSLLSCHIIFNDKLNVIQNCDLEGGKSFASNQNPQF